MTSQQLTNQGAVLKVFNPRAFLALLYDAPERTSQTIKEVAKRMGEPNPNHLGRQLNPDDAGAKLGVEDFIYYLAATDLEPLLYINRAFGLVAVPVPGIFEDGVFLAAKASEAAREFGEWLEKVGRFTDPGSEAGAEISPGEARQLIAEGDDVLRVFFGTRAWLVKKAKTQP
ncbi:MAG: hypothetical protein KQJ78_19580 [Deltaproteobacteria bacterium]|nr:hypothetical protein [Deltaproteobacteria bacterium]